MRFNSKTTTAFLTIFMFAFAIGGVAFFSPGNKINVIAQESKSNTAVPTPSPAPEFDQQAAIAKLREQIKGKENEPAETVFKNIQNFKGVPASRLLAIMNFGYSRSLGVNCTHCHNPENWASEAKPTKQIARDMQIMSGKINEELLSAIKGLQGRTMAVNCTTCHRGETKPATNMPMPN